MKTAKNTILLKLKWTIFGLSISMLIIWLFSFIGIRGIVQKYAMENMEQTSIRIITELNDAFLRLEELSFSMTNNEAVRDFVTTEDILQFHTKASTVENELADKLGKVAITKDIIVYNNWGEFYRFSGNLSNVNIQRIIRLCNKKDQSDQFQIMLDQRNYIAYITSIKAGETELGRVVMLIDEDEVIRLFRRMESDADMKLALAANHKIVISTAREFTGYSSEKFLGMTQYHIQKQVGFTPFELIITYEDTGHEMNAFLVMSMAVMALLCLFAVRAFIRFWRKKFFEPIQNIISGVEDFGGEHSEALPLTGLEHLDGLVCGINDMIARIEQREKELYSAAFSMQSLEIKKQKALIISLKKQISAHFTINILNIIMALSETGENEKVGLLCDGLSYLLRYANEGDSYINGMEEFFVLSKYISMMEIRYRDKFKAEIDPEDYLEEIMLPRMLVQPIVENSILHGFTDKSMNGSGRLHIYSVLNEEKFSIIVEDNGCGMDEAKLYSLNEAMKRILEEDRIEVEGLSHVALLNIQRRIYSYFGEGYGIEIESAKGKGTKVILTLPMIKVSCA